MNRRKMRHSQVVLALLCTAFYPAGAQTQSISSYQLIQSGTIALQQGNYSAAKAYFEHAEKLPDVNIAEVNAGLAMAELQLGNYQSARDRETKVLNLVHSAHERAEAHNLIGTAWLRESLESPTGVDHLRTAQSEFQQAISLDPIFYYAYFNLGNALSQEGRGKEAAAAFRKSIDAASQNPAFTLNLPLTQKTPISKFSASDSKGHIVSSDSLKGRFVLLEFWATWCSPCIRALPVIRQLSTYLPPDQFVLISVNEDSDRELWRKFVANENMDWTQIWDANSGIYSLFDLARRGDLSIPRYLFLDPDGHLLRTYSGTDHLDLIVAEIVNTVKPQTQTGKLADDPGR